MRGRSAAWLPCEEAVYTRLQRNCRLCCEFEGQTTHRRCSRKHTHLSARLWLPHHLAHARGLAARLRACSPRGSHARKPPPSTSRSSRRSRPLSRARSSAAAKCASPAATRCCSARSHRLHSRQRGGASLPRVLAQGQTSRGPDHPTPRSAVARRLPSWGSSASGQPAHPLPAVLTASGRRWRACGGARREWRQSAAAPAGTPRGPSAAARHGKEAGACAC